MTTFSKNSGSVRAIRAGIFSLLLLTGDSLRAQVIASWSFTSSIAGVPGSFNTVSVADFSPAIPTRAFNAGTEYYGHNGWPTVGLDASYYLSFTLSPNTGYALNILSMNLRMRHSNTGSSGGSGPTLFTVRSSLDGYTGDVATGSLTGSYSNFIISPGAAFNNLPTAVTFRIYGHDAVIYSGGNNRLVFDNIQVDAIGIILPLKFISFRATAGSAGIILQYQVNDVAADSHVFIERSVDNRTFQVIGSEKESSYQVSKSYSHTDVNLPADINDFYFRLKISEPGGKNIYSKVLQVTKKRQGQGLTVRYNRNSLKLEGIEPTASKLFIYNSSGRMLLSRSMLHGITSQTINNLPPFPKGIYYLKILSLRDGQAASFISNY